MSETCFGAVIVHLLNRETGEVKQMLMYPATRVELCEPNAEKTCFAPTREFIAAEPHCWRERS